MKSAQCSAWENNLKQLLYIMNQKCRSQGRDSILGSPPAKNIGTKSSCEHKNTIQRRGKTSNGELWSKENTRHRKKSRLFGETGANLVSGSQWERAKHLSSICATSQRDGMSFQANVAMAHRRGLAVKPTSIHVLGWWAQAHPSAAE